MTPTPAGNLIEIRSAVLCTCSKKSTHPKTKLIVCYRQQPSCNKLPGRLVRVHQTACKAEYTLFSTNAHLVAVTNHPDRGGLWLSWQSQTKTHGENCRRLNSHHTLIPTNTAVHLCFPWRSRSSQKEGFHWSRGICRRSTRPARRIKE